MAQDQAALQALSDAVKNATADGSNTATKIGELTESIIQNMGLSSNYRLVAGVIRNSGSGWDLLDDNDHTPLNIDSCTNNTLSVTIDYASIGATEVVSLVACPDETYAGQYSFGASVGLTSSGIQIKNLSRTGKAMITHNGNGSFSVANQNGSVFSGLSLSYNNVNGRLDFTHNSCQGIPKIWDMTGNTQIVSGLDTEGYTKTYMKFYNLDGTQQTLTDPEVHRFLIERELFVKPLADPNEVANAGGNVWIIGIFKIA